LHSLLKRCAPEGCLTVIAFAVFALLLRTLPAGAADISQLSDREARSEKNPNQRVVAVLFSVSQTENARKQFRR
jgi:hypothetical protein